MSGVIQQYRLRSGLIHTWLGGSVAEMKMRLLHAGGGPFVIEGLDESGEWGEIERGNVPGPRLPRPAPVPKRACSFCGRRDEDVHPTRTTYGLTDAHEECAAGDIVERIKDEAVV